LVFYVDVFVKIHVRQLRSGGIINHQYHSSVIAAGTLFAARIQGVDVPQQLSIVGVEDSPFSRQAWPNLTTAQQPNATIAERATGLLIDTIRNKRDVESEGFYPQLIVRDSTCPAPSKR